MSLPIYQRVAVTDAGDVIPGAEYTVINENTGVAAPIYSDRTGSSLKSAPYFADSVGTIQFFIAQGTTFRVAASGGVGTYTDRYVYGVSAAVLALADGSATINRVGSDGSALTIQKDGATVGSIGTLSGDMTIGTGDAGLRFNNPYGELLPHNVSTNSGTDATVTLGSGAVRFKDLYLSGGVVFGDAGGTGTSSSNTLDQYERGTFVPTSPDVTLTGTSGSYLRVGDVVHVSMVFNLPSSASSTGVNISGLPFAPWNNNSNRGGLSIAYISGSADSNITALLSASGNVINFFISSSAQTYGSFSSRIIYLGGTYIAA